MFLVLNGQALCGYSGTAAIYSYVAVTVSIMCRQFKTSPICIPRSAEFNQWEVEVALNRSVL